MAQTTSSPAMVEVDGQLFPRFSLTRLLSTVFEIRGDERIGVFTDLPDPSAVKDLAFLATCTPGTPQHHAYHTLLQGLTTGEAADLSYGGVQFYAYAEVGGSNLELPETLWTPTGAQRNLRQVLGELDLVIYMGTWSATAPITALAKEIGFRGATMHGANDKVLATGLSVDYEEVSARAEALRQALSAADAMRLCWRVGDESYTLEIALSGQQAQKSHGLVRTLGDVANLPAGEVYYVPTGAEGHLPQQLEDSEETIVVFNVTAGTIASVHKLVRGSQANVDAYMARIAEDPAAGLITELGLGTQSLPFAGTDIQDEKILGTAHVATGRSDHLGGSVGPKDFTNPGNASHNDILYTPEKTPDVALAEVTMIRAGAETTIMAGYEPSAFIQGVLDAYAQS